MDKKFIVPATESAILSDCARAIRLGTSSPNTKVNNAITLVTINVEIQAAELDNTGTFKSHTYRTAGSVVLYKCNMENNRKEETV